MRKSLSCSWKDFWSLIPTILTFPTSLVKSFTLIGHLPEYCTIRESRKGLNMNVSIFQVLGFGDTDSVIPKKNSSFLFRSTEWPKSTHTTGPRQPLGLSAFSTSSGHLHSPPLLLSLSLFLAHFFFFASPIRKATLSMLTPLPTLIIIISLQISAFQSFSSIGSICSIFIVTTIFFFRYLLSP